MEEALNPVRLPETENDFLRYITGMARLYCNTSKPTMLHLLKDLAERIDYVFEFTNFEK